MPTSIVKVRSSVKLLRIVSTNDLRGASVLFLKFKSISLALHKTTFESTFIKNFSKQIENSALSGNILDFMFRTVKYATLKFCTAILYLKYSRLILDEI